MFGIIDLETGKCWSSEEVPEYWLPDHEKLNAFTYRSYASERSAVPKEYINTWKSGHKCDQDRCFKDGCVECHVPETSPDADNLQMMLPPSNSIEHFCCDHAFKNGYCICCGEFWGGIEDFDFGNGFCTNCKSACDLEDGEPEEDDIFI